MIYCILTTTAPEKKLPPSHQPTKEKTRFMRLSEVRISPQPIVQTKNETLLEALH